MGDQIFPNRMAQTVQNSPILQLLGANPSQSEPVAPQGGVPAQTPPAPITPEADYFGQQPSTAFRDAEAAGTPMAQDAASVSQSQLPPRPMIPSITGHPTNDRALARRQAIAGIESGGRYNAIGPRTKNGDRAYGKYQVMGNNVPVWTKAALGR